MSSPTSRREGTRREFSNSFRSRVWTLLAYIFPSGGLSTSDLFEHFVSLGNVSSDTFI
jgi:hypothetical protein